MVFLIERVLPPGALAVLLVFQLGHLSVEWAHSRVPLYSGLYSILEEDKPFLPSAGRMKDLAIQLGTLQGLRLNAESVDVGAAQDRLRVIVRTDGHPDWGRFFVSYRDDLRRAMFARGERVRLLHECTCLSLPPIPFEGWSVAHGSWVKPLDLASLTVLAISLVMWLSGRRPGRAQ